MTREKAKNDLHQKLYMDILNIDKFINSIYDSLEAKIAEFEAPKNCDGCKYDVDGFACSKQAEDNCFRLEGLNDYYEPKDD